MSLRVDIYNEYCVCGSQNQKTMDPLELELQAVSCELPGVGAENQTWVLCKSSKYSYLLSHPSSPYSLCKVLDSISQTSHV